MSFDFIDPRGSMQGAGQHEPAARLNHLDGVKVGLLDNGKRNAAKFLDMVAEYLVADYGAGEVRRYRKEALSKPCPPETIEELVEFSELGVTGIGDCGSCSTNSVHDGIEIEKLGVPCVAVCTEAFVAGLDALTKMRGMPDYRFAVVPHPLGVLFDDELRERAKLAAGQVADLAVEPQQVPDAGRQPVAER
jgi:hypothetical protein